MVSKKISLMALFTAFAVILSYIETFIPTVGIPGAKLGLANFMVMYAVGNKEAFFINVIRIIIIGLFFGNMFSICFSIAGALVSFIGMVLLKSTKRISMITVAIIGGVLHNVGQIIIASVILKNVGIFTYVPILMIAGIITGTVIGILSNILYKRTREYIKL